MPVAEQRLPRSIHGRLRAVERVFDCIIHRLFDVCSDRLDFGLAGVAGVEHVLPELRDVVGSHRSQFFQARIAELKLADRG